MKKDEEQLSEDVESGETEEEKVQEKELKKKETENRETEIRETDDSLTTEEEQSDPETLENEEEQKTDDSAELEKKSEDGESKPKEDELTPEEKAEELERIKFRKKRRRARSLRRFRKNFLIVVSIIVIACAAFLITMKLCNPQWEIKSIIPEKEVKQAVAYVKEDILNITTTTSAPTTKPTTTRPPNYDYVDFSDFAFDTSLQGNQMGNLLNNTKGAVTYNSSYIFFSVENDGLYRFEPQNETSAALITGGRNLKYLNILGETVYFVDTDSNKLEKASVSGKNEKTVAENISFAYLYNDKIYFIGTDNTVGYITTDNQKKTVLYTCQGDKELNFVGISLSRVFFTEYDSQTNVCQYKTVSVTDSEDVQYFRDDTKDNTIKNLQLEGGYFYYYEKQQDLSFNLIRQKFGSEKTVKLLENCNLSDYPVIYKNRLYYTNKSGDNIQGRELNMNSMETKNMLTVYDTDSSAQIGVGYGYQYVFLIGTKDQNANKAYSASCIYTSSSTDNIIEFSGGRWHY